MFSYKQRLDFIIKINSLHNDVLHYLRDLKIHTQLFYKIINNLIICKKLRKINEITERSKVLLRGLLHISQHEYYC